MPGKVRRYGDDSRDGQAGPAQTWPQSKRQHRLSRWASATAVRSFLGLTEPVSGSVLHRGGRRGLTSARTGASFWPDPSWNPWLRAAAKADSPVVFQAKPTKSTEATGKFSVSSVPLWLYFRIYY